VVYKEMTSRLFAIIVVEEMGLTRHLKLKVLKCRKESEIRLPGWKLYDAKIMKRQVITSLLCPAFRW
jgi:hypothetical protein